MPTRKIAEPNDGEKKCMDPEHNVPQFMVFEPGTYEHECPSCGNIIRFTIRSKGNANWFSDMPKAPKPALAS